MRGLEPPKRPRAQHRTEWVSSKAAAEGVLEAVRAYNLANAVGGLGDLCYVEDHEGEGRRNDERAWGETFDHYAQRVLSRATGAQSTRADERRIYAEDVIIPDISDEPLGLRDRWGAMPIAALTRKEVRRWLDETAARPGRKPGTMLSPSQVRQRFYLLTKIIREALDDEAIDVDPTQRLRPPTPPQGRAVTGLLRAEEDHRWLPTEEQMRTIIDVAEQRSRLPLALMFGLGLRISEVTVLERGDLTRMGSQQWAVSVAKGEPQRGGGRTLSDTKNHKAHTQYTPQWVGEMIEAHLAQHKDMGPRDRLFPAIGRRPAVSISHTVIRRDLTAACEAAGVDRLTPQDLRAAGEAHVVRLLGRPAAAEWARHGLGVQMGHYVGAQRDQTARAAAGWDND